MPEQNSNNLDEIMVEDYRAIFSALESRLHLIGSVIDAESRKEILTQQIYDKGDFYGNTGYLLQTTDTAMILRVGSNVRHEPFAITLNPLQAKSSGNPICPPSPVKCLPGLRSLHLSLGSNASTCLGLIKRQVKL